MRVRIGIDQHIIEEENIIGNVLDKIEITIKNDSRKYIRKALTLSVGAFLWFVITFDSFFLMQMLSIVSPPFKEISRETEKNKGIAPIYVTNHYKWRFFAFDLYIIKDYYYIK